MNNQILTDSGSAEQQTRLLHQIRRLATWLDAAVRIPGTRFTLGLDALVGLLPVAGDLFGAAMSSWLIWSAARVGAPPSVIGRMVRNVAVDIFVGVVPVVGDLLDVAFRANLRNLEMLEHWLEQETAEPPAARPSTRSTKWVLSLIAVAMLLLFLGLSWVVAGLLNVMILGQ